MRSILMGVLALSLVACATNGDVRKAKRESRSYDREQDARIVHAEEKSQEALDAVDELEVRMGRVFQFTQGK